ncbi:MAG: flagellar basal body L-ring protein, partial [Pseudomonadota bacterium]
MLALFAGCARLENVGKVPEFTPISGSVEEQAMQFPVAMRANDPLPQHKRASLWSGARGSLLGDRRAERQGDILTVVIEID